MTASRAAIWPVGAGCRLDRVIEDRFEGGVQKGIDQGRRGVVRAGVLALITRRDIQGVLLWSRRPSAERTPAAPRRCCRVLRAEVAVVNNPQHTGFGFADQRQRPHRRQQGVVADLMLGEKVQFADVEESADTGRPSSGRPVSLPSPRHTTSVPASGRCTGHRHDGDATFSQARWRSSRRSGLFAAGSAAGSRSAPRSSATNVNSSRYTTRSRA